VAVSVRGGVCVAVCGDSVKCSVRCVPVALIDDVVPIYHQYTNSTDTRILECQNISLMMLYQYTNSTDTRILECRNISNRYIMCFLTLTRYETP
jgi:hypothetical protein